MKNLYFVAHQDDELCNTGVLLSFEAENFFEDTYVVLFTDGGASGVKTVLCDEKDCWLHNGKHIYPLTREEFSLARDREFIESCSLIGVKNENVIISKNRGLDGSLSEEQAERIICDTLSLFPDETDFRIRAVSPKFIGRQNPDHKVIGETCEMLFEKGLFSEILLVTDSCFEGNCREEFPDIVFFELTAHGKAFEKIKDAAECYGKWEPENGRFSVGWHSVKGEFEEIVRNPRVIFHTLRRNF